MGQILLAGEEAHERSALSGVRVANGAAQHGIARLERVEHRAWVAGLDSQLDLAVDPRERAQMRRQHDANHDSVCDFDREHGRQVTNDRGPGVPESGEAYTWPPVVPK